MRDRSLPRGRARKGRHLRRQRRSLPQQASSRHPGRSPAVVGSGVGQDHSPDRRRRHVAADRVDGHPVLAPGKTTAKPDDGQLARGQWRRLAEESGAVMRHPEPDPRTAVDRSRNQQPVTAHFGGRGEADGHRARSCPSSRWHGLRRKAEWPAERWPDTLKTSLQILKIQDRKIAQRNGKHQCGKSTASGASRPPGGSLP